MFSFSIQPEYVSEQGDFGDSGHAYLDVMFGTQDDEGDTIVGWNAVYLDIFYINDAGTGITYLDQADGSDFQNVALTELTGNHVDIWFIREDYTAGTPLTWLQANRGRMLYFYFRNASNSSRKLFSGQISWDSKTVSNHQKVLGLLGENLLLDSFGYDAAGNITNLRVRVFDSNTNALAATADITDVPETGEVAIYDVTQTHNLPRNVRSSHLSVLSS